MSLVGRHCSILNYLAHEDNDLFELIRELCVGHILNPRHKAGVTFLRPDAALLKELLSMAKSEPEKVVQCLHAMTILAVCSNVSDFNSPLSTFARKKFPVESVASGVVKLKGGGVVKPDPKFAARSDRDNIAVFILSGALVPTDTEPSTAEPKPKAKKGGAEYNNERAALFKAVVQHQFKCESGRNPAMEVLVSLMHWAGKNNPALLEVIEAQLSNDALATLAVVLQPYKSSPTYISAADYGNFASEYSVKETELYSYCANPVHAYNEHKKAAIQKHASLYNVIKDASDKIAQLGSKPTMSKDATRALDDLMSKLQAVRGAGFDTNLALCEAELRVLSAQLQEDDCNAGNYEQMVEKCNLNAPQYCTNTDLINNANVAFFYSTVYLIVRSGIAYIPHDNSSEGKLSELVTSNKRISLDKHINLGEDSYYKDRIGKIQDQLKKFQ